MEDKIIKALNEIGCIIDSYNEDDKLSEYIVDSLSLISFIINIEENFNCNIEAQYLTKGLYDTTIAEFKNIIKNSI